MDLECPLPVMMGQGLEITFGVAPGPGIGTNSDCHGLPEYGQSLLQDDRLLLMEKQKPAVDRSHHLVLVHMNCQVSVNRISQVIA